MMVIMKIEADHHDLLIVVVMIMAGSLSANSQSSSSERLGKMYPSSLPVT